MSADLALFERAMNAQLAIVAGNAKVHTPEAGAMVAFWSRVFAYLGDVCTLMSHGSYQSCVPLMRAACDCIAAQLSLASDEFREYREWLESAIGQDRRHGALSFSLGRFRAGSVYRLLTELSMPHFGSTPPGGAGLEHAEAIPDVRGQQFSPGMGRADHRVAPGPVGRATDDRRF